MSSSRLDREHEGGAAGAAGDVAPASRIGAGSMVPGLEAGLPRGLRAGIAQLSGLDLGDVRVHRDSAEPAAMNAAAFARGTDIHLGPGQGDHLPHEAWHVVQQQQGRVQATEQFAGRADGNADPALEREADDMGGRAAALAGMPSRGAEHADRAPAGGGAAPISVELPDGSIAASGAGAATSAPHGGGVVQRVNLKQQLTPEQAARLPDGDSFEIELDEERVTSKVKATIGEVLDEHGVDLAPVGLDPLALQKILDTALDTGKVNKLTWNYQQPGLERPTSRTWKLVVRVAEGAKQSGKSSKKEYDGAAIEKSNVRKIGLFEQLRDAMSGFGLPVFLVGGAVANVRYESPRELKDLDLKTLAIDKPFDKYPGLVERINAFIASDFIPKHFTGAAFERFELAEKNPNAIDGKIDGCEVTIARILNPETMAQYDPAFESDGVIAGVDMIIDKANSFIFRTSDQKKSTDLFDMLWGMKAQPLDPRELPKLLDAKRGDSYRKEAQAKESSRGGYHAPALSTGFALSLQELMSRGMQTVRTLLYQYVGDREAARAIIPLLEQLCAAFGVAYHERGGGDPVVIIQAGNMTGDMFGVSSALVLNPLAHIVIVSDGSDKDRTASMQRFYIDSTQAPDRVHVLRVPLDPEQKLDMNTAYTKFAGRTKHPLPYGELAPALPPAVCSPDRQQPISGATTQTAQNFDKKTSHDEIKQRWGVAPEDHAEALGQFLAARGVPATGSYVALWLRFSGKRGGPHAQHDTGFTALRQMVHLAQSEGHTVLLCGDQPDAEGKLGELTAQGAISLVEFWDDPAWSERFPGGKRQEQLMLFEHLHQHATLKHLGFRSGNLEAYALLGHTVRYMEETGNLQAGRMEAWHSERRGNIGYDRIQIEGRAPTMTGQWVTENAERTRSEEKPPWIEHPLHLHKESYVPGPLRDKDYKRNNAPHRGFEVGDLEKIHDYLKASPLPGSPTWMLELERKRHEYKARGWRLLLDDLDAGMLDRLRDFRRMNDPQAPMPKWLGKLIDELEHRDEEERQAELARRREVQEAFQDHEPTSEFDYPDWQ